MDSALLTPVEVLPANADLASLVVRLLAEVDELRADMAALRRENLELRQQAGYWRSRHADAVQRLAELEQENEQLRGEIRKLQAERFGRRPLARWAVVALRRSRSVSAVPTVQPRKEC
jgi:hypothetical protein